MIINNSQCGIKSITDVLTSSNLDIFYSRTSPYIVYGNIYFQQRIRDELIRIRANLSFPNSDHFHGNLQQTLQTFFLLINKEIGSIIIQADTSNIMKKLFAAVSDHCKFMPSDLDMKNTAVVLETLKNLHNIFTL